MRGRLNSLRFLRKIYPDPINSGLSTLRGLLWALGPSLQSHPHVRRPAAGSAEPEAAFSGGQILLGEALA